MNCILINSCNVIYLNMNVVKDPACNDFQVPHISITWQLLSLPSQIKTRLANPCHLSKHEITRKMKLPYPLLDRSRDGFDKYIHDDIFGQCLETRTTCVVVYNIFYVSTIDISICVIGCWELPAK